MVAFNSSSSLSRVTDVATDPVARRASNRLDAQHDARLVHRFQGGDETAFAEIVSRHRSKTFSVALGHLRNRADAEEIVQDTFIRAHRALATFRGESSLATWLHRVTVNLALNRYWYFFRRGRHLARSFDSALGAHSSVTLADVVASPAPDPAAEALTDEFTRLVAEAMKRVAPDHREILRLRNGLNRSYGQIAVALGIKVGTVKSRIARARKILRATIAQTSPEFSAASSLAEWFGGLRPAAGLQAVLA